jgi:hypothetical protein
MVVEDINQIIQQMVTNTVAWVADMLVFLEVLPHRQRA